MSEAYVCHCFAVGREYDPYDLFTLCGQVYEFETIAMWPMEFQELVQGRDDVGSYDLCPACVEHEDLPLALLGGMP